MRHSSTTVPASGPATAQLNRRQFLKSASMIAVAVAMIPVTPVFAGVLTESGKLTDAETRFYQKMVAVCLPAKGHNIVDPATLPVVATLEGALMAGMPPHIREGVRGGAMYLNDAAKQHYGKPFVEITDAQAREFLDRWGESDQIPHRALAMGLKKLTCLAYWAIPNTWAPLGYDGPISDRIGLKPLGNTPEPMA